MRVEATTCFGAALFLAVTAAIYWFWSREQTGTVCLIFGLCAYGMIAGYFYLQYRHRQGIPRPEDREDAEQADGAGEVGFFPAASIWPAGIGLGAIFAGVAMIYGDWYWLIAGILILGAIIGFTVEAEAREEGPNDPGGGDPARRRGRPPPRPSPPSAPQRPRRGRRGSEPALTPPAARPPRGQTFAVA
jgi:Cytochrome c oxidase subunit IV